MCCFKVDFKDKKSVQQAEQAIAARFEIWRSPGHYGEDQHLMHPCAGWYFKPDQGTLSSS